jgi:hypothetical protein
MKFFPKNDLFVIGSISPKALIRQHGTVVDKNDNQPLEPKINELKRQINQTNNKEQREELRDKLEKLYENSKYIIDLHGKILVFLESPHPEVWNIIKSVLSHDVWEIPHPYVDVD